MKIMWLIEDREIPGVGIFRQNEIKDIDYLLANELIIQGHAKKVKKAKPKNLKNLNLKDE